MKVKSYGRDHYIDFLKGITCLSIVSIHTACWSGQSYVPDWFWNLTLIIDVPFFFYLSGWGGSLRENNIFHVCNGILKLWIKWCYFISLIAILLWGISTITGIRIVGVYDLRDLIQNYMFNVSFDSLPVIGGSIWFMEIYVVVVLLSNLVLTVLRKTDNSHRNEIAYMWILFAGFIWTSFGRWTIGLDIIYFTFYGFFYMYGYNSHGELKVNIYKCIIIIFFCIIATSYIQNIQIYDFQNAKFPPSLKYGCFSMIVIFIARHNKGKYKVNWLSRFIEHIGKHAIFYFFGQGIGSSLLYIIVNYCHCRAWFLKWLAMYGINLVLTVLIAESLAFLYGKLINDSILDKTKLATSRIYDRWD